MIKQSSRRFHPEFDLEAARTAYASLSIDESFIDDLITSPYDLHVVESLRDQRQLRTGQDVPADIFVFCKGEPEKPDCTKVGGMPYWIEDRKWPVDKSRKSLRFLAQFNFVDSKDLFDELPGDVLLMFVGAGKHPDFGQIHFEWLPAGKTPVPTTEAKRLLFPTSVFHGAIYRSADYPESKATVLASGAFNSEKLFLLNGTKIGGRPHFIQSDHDLKARAAKVRKNPFNPKETMIEPARPSRKGYLCQLGSIQAHPEVAYPWANQREPLSLNEIYHDDNTIVFDDMGSIFVYRSENGDFWSSCEGY